MINSGKVTVTWKPEDYTDLEWHKQPIMESEISTWRDQGYYHQSFSGFMYDSKKPMPDFVEGVGKEIGLNSCGYVIYRMDTLDIMPTHVDHFETYMRIFNQPRDHIVRALVLLEDWKPGHYLEVDGTAHTNWSAGDYWSWSADVPHAASNIGILPRYTLQITGVYT